MKKVKKKGEKKSKKGLTKRWRFGKINKLLRERRTLKTIQRKRNARKNDS